MPVPNADQKKHVRHSSRPDKSGKSRPDKAGKSRPDKSGKSCSGKSGEDSHGALGNDSPLYACCPPSSPYRPHPLVNSISDPETGKTSRQLDDALQALHTLLAVTPAATMVLDVDGNVRGGWNPAATALLGWTFEEVKGKPVPGLRENGGALADAVSTILAGGRFAPQPARVPTQQGQEIEVSASGAPLSRNGRITGGLLILDDRSERARLESQLRQAQKLEAVGQLAGGIAHDFNNLLTIVQTNAEILADDLEEHPSAGDHLSDIQDAVERGAQLVRRLMVFSRDEPIRKETLDVGLLVERYATTLQRVLPETIQVEVALGPNIAPIHADPGAIQQILLNLATNARDAMPEGGQLVLQVSRAAPTGTTSEEDGWTMISVGDTGSGMTAEVKKRVFEPFFTTKDAEKGTGLGLSMVYGLVTQHGGKVSIETNLGRGTEFRLFFPIADITATPIFVEEPVEEPKIDNRPELGSELASETILVVEDDASIRKVIKRSLTSRGYEVIMAGDGEQALEALRHHANEVDLVISDLIMPRMDGVTLYEQHVTVGNPVPFLFISGYGEQDPRIEALLAEGVPILHKPWSVQGLCDTVRTVLNRSTDSKGVDSVSPPVTGSTLEANLN